MMRIFQRLRIYIAVVDASKHVKDVFAEKNYLERMIRNQNFVGCNDKARCGLHNEVLHALVKFDVCTVTGETCSVLFFGCNFLEGQDNGDNVPLPY